MCGGRAAGAGAADGYGCARLLACAPAPREAVQPREAARRRPRRRYTTSGYPRVPTTGGAAGRRRLGVVRTPTPRPGPCEDQWPATISGEAHYGIRHSTLRPALRCAHAVAPVPQSGSPPPPPARQAGPVTGARACAGAPGPLFSFRHASGGTNVQHPCGVTHTPRMQGQRAARRCGYRRRPWVPLLQQERTPRTAWCAAPVAMAFQRLTVCLRAGCTSIQRNWYYLNVA